jgi:hypothetical protein
VTAMAGTGLASDSAFDAADPSLAVAPLRRVTGAPVRASAG